MGTLRSKTNYKGQVINDVTLGEPVVLTEALEQAGTGESIEDLYFCWDDSALPSGEIVDGEVVPD